MNDIASREAKLAERAKQIDHILSKPETYIGTVSIKRMMQWVLAPEEDRLIHKKIDFIPGLYKILDEALITTAENYHIDRAINTFKFDIEPKDARVSIWFNGSSAPVQMHHELKAYLPELLYGDFVNVPGFEDHLKQLTGERFFMGFKLANVFSSSFTLETGDSKNRLKFRMRWDDHMKVPSEPEISEFNGSDYTLVSFNLDISRFGLTTFEGDMLALFKKRICDIAGIISANISVFLNNRKISIKGFTNYVDLYLAGRPEKTTVKIQDPETNNFRWQVIATLSDGTFQQVSFVNSICTPNGGTHADLISEQIMFKLFEGLKGKCQMLGLRPHHLRNSFWIFINCLVEEPQFDTPSRETLLTKTPRFGSRCRVTEKFVRMLVRSGLLTNLATYVQDIPQIKANRIKRKIFKKVKKFTFSKFEDAPNTGDSQAKLIITENEANKQTFSSLLDCLPSRENYGILVMRSKLQNAREPLGPDGVNPEFAVLMKMMGLEIGRQPDESTIRYNGIVFAVDSNPNSFYFIGLVFNFFHLYWPGLLSIPKFFTVLRIENGEYSLGAMGKDKIADSLNNLDSHLTLFHYEKEKDDDIFNSVFHPCLSTSQRSAAYNKLADELANKEQEYFFPEGEINIGKFIKAASYSHFKSELQRTVPCILNGLTKFQQNIMLTALNNFQNSQEIVLSSLVAKSIIDSPEESASESVWFPSVVSLAQEFVGSNNFPLLRGIGNFGSRNSGGRDISTPQNLSVSVPEFTKEIFRISGNRLISPIPAALLNGAQSITCLGPTALPPSNVQLIIEFLIKGLNEYMKEDSGTKKKKKDKKKGKSQKNITEFFDFASLELSAYYPFFQGQVERVSIPKPSEEQPSSSTIVPPQLNLGPNIGTYLHGPGSSNKAVPNTGFISHGSFKVYGGWLEIKELPVGKWIKDYKDFLSNRRDIAEIHEFREGSSVKFYVRMKDPSALQKIEKSDGILKNFRLTTHLSDCSMFLLSKSGKMLKFNSLREIVKEFVKLIIPEYEEFKNLEITRLKELCISSFLIQEISDDKKEKCRKELSKLNIFSSDSEFEHSFNSSNCKFTHSHLEPPLLNEILAILNDLKAKSPETLWLEDLYKANSAYSLYYQEINNSIESLKRKQIGHKPIESFCNPKASLVDTKKSPLPNALLSLNGPFLDPEGSEDMSFDEETYSQDSMMIEEMNAKLDEGQLPAEQGISFEEAQLSFGDEIGKGKFNRVAFDGNGKVNFSAADPFSGYN